MTRQGTTTTVDTSTITITADKQTWAYLVEALVASWQNIRHLVARDVRAELSDLTRRITGSLDLSGLNRIETIKTMFPTLDIRVIESQANETLEGPVAPKPETIQ